MTSDTDDDHGEEVAPIALGEFDGGESPSPAVVELPPVEGSAVPSDGGQVVRFVEPLGGSAAVVVADAPVAQFSDLQQVELIPTRCRGRGRSSGRGRGRPKKSGPSVSLVEPQPELQVARMAAGGAEVLAVLPAAIDTNGDTLGSFASAAVACPAAVGAFAATYLLA